MLTFVKGNLMSSKALALVNTVNTVGVMGKGIALQFKNEFPHNDAVYRQACRNNELKPGILLPVIDHSILLGERLIINFPTKTHWRLPSEYTYIEQGLIALTTFIAEEQLESIALPALGCGNGGLNWSRVKTMIVGHLESLSAMIEIYEPIF